MKLKKIISAVLAFSMVSAMGIMNVKAANYANPIIHVDSEVFTDTSATNYKPVAGYTTYLVSYSVEGIDYEAGAQLDGFTIDYTVTGDYAEKSFVKSVTSGAPANKDLKGIYKVIAGLQMISAKQIVFGSADGIWDNVDWTTYEYGSPADVKTLPFIQTLIYVKDDSTVDFTYNTGLNSNGDATSKMVFADGSSYVSEIVYYVNGAKSNTLTLGAKAPEEPVITGTETASAVTAGEKTGKVWNGVKIEDVTLGKNYKVKFTDSNSESITYDLDLNGKEVEGDIDFAVILKSATRDVANVVMEILYDAVN